MKRASLAALAAAALLAAGCGDDDQDSKDGKASRGTEIANGASAGSGTPAPAPVAPDSAPAGDSADGRVGVAGPGSCVETPDDPAQDLVAVQSATLCLLNAERATRQLPPLTSDPKLAEAATEHSRDMVQRNYFAHDTLGGGGFEERVIRVGYLRGATGHSIGENIARGTGAGPEEIVSDWMASPDHRSNVLSREFTEIGVGIAVGPPEDGDDESALTYTANFGARRFASVAVSAANPTPRPANPTPRAAAVVRGPKRGTRPNGRLPFSGARLAIPSLRTEIIKGFVFMRVRCSPRTFAGARRPNDFGFCFGTVSIATNSGRPLARAPFSIRSGDSVSVDVPAPKALQRLANRAGRLNLNIVVRSRDGQGNSRTTTGKLSLAKSK